MPAQFFASASATTALTSASVLALNALADGKKDFLSFFADNVGTFDVSGADKDLVLLTTQAISASKVYIILALNANADHKKKSNYKVDIVAKLTEYEDNVLVIDADVSATTAPIFSTPVLASGAATIVVNDDKRDSIYTFAADESSTYAIFGADSANFSLTAGGVLSFASFEAADAKTEYVVQVKAISTYNTSNFTTASLTIQVINNKSPTFLTGTIDAQGTIVKSDNYALPFQDSTSTVTIDVATLYLSQACTYVLGGEDASHFTITSSSTNTPVITLKAGLEHRNIAIYNLVVTATNADSKSASKIITLTRNSDLSKPIVTLAAGNNAVTYVPATDATAATFTISDTYDTSLPIMMITADENVMLTLEPTSNNLTLVDGKISMTTAILKNTSSESSFDIVATDLSGNDTKVPVILRVTDQSAPVITALSPSTVSVNNVNLTPMETVVLIFTSDEELTTNFVDSDFTFVGATMVTDSFTGDKTTATFSVTPHTPAANSTKDVTVTLNVDAVRDIKDNKNAKTEFKFVHDPRVPVFAIQGPNPYYLKVGDSYQEHNPTSSFIDGDLTITQDPIVNTSSASEYHVKYVAKSKAGLVKIAIRKVIVSAVGAQSGNVDFVLEMDLSKTVSALSMRAIEPEVDILRNLPRVDLNVKASSMNNLFLTKPTGHEDYTSLPPLNLLLTDDVNYKTKSENWPVIKGAATRYIASDSVRRLKDYPLDGNMVQNMTYAISAQSIPRAAFLKQLYQIFGDRENLGENIVTNETSVLAEMGTYLTVGMVADIKASIDNANNKTNSDIGPDNFTHALIRQLHRGISGTENEVRLTNKEIFAPTNLTEDGFFKFLFRDGDSLSIVVKLIPTANAVNFLTNSATFFEAVLKLKMVADTASVENAN